MYCFLLLPLLVRGTLYLRSKRAFVPLPAHPRVLRRPDRTASVVARVEDDFQEPRWQGNWNSAWHGTINPSGPRKRRTDAFMPDRDDAQTAHRIAEEQWRQNLLDFYRVCAAGLAIGICLIWLGRGVAQHRFFFTRAEIALTAALSWFAARGGDVFSRTVRPPLWSPNIERRRRVAPTPEPQQRQPLPYHILRVDFEPPELLGVATSLSSARESSPPPAVPAAPRRSAGQAVRRSSEKMKTSIGRLYGQLSSKLITSTPKQRNA
jgi:hypothetical protein